jgi:hypothetical protein
MRQKLASFAEVGYTCFTLRRCATGYISLRNPWDIRSRAASPDIVHSRNSGVFSAVGTCHIVPDDRSGSYIPRIYTLKGHNLRVEASEK